MPEFLHSQIVARPSFSRPLGFLVLQLLESPELYLMSKVHNCLRYCVYLTIKTPAAGFLRPGIRDEAASNFGLLDQIAALLWLRENIAEFGGDPNSVTLVGHGTGAIFANLLLISPVANKKGKRNMHVCAIRGNPTGILHDSFSTFCALGNRLLFAFASPFGENRILSKRERLLATIFILVRKNRKTIHNPS